MAEMPIARRWRGLSLSRGAPPTSISPLSGVLAPDSMRIMVDLPAPLAPTRPCTSPPSRSKLTSRSACTPGKLLLTCRSRTATGAASGADAWAGVTNGAPAALAERPPRAAPLSVVRMVFVGDVLGDHRSAGALDHRRHQSLIDVSVDRLAFERHDQCDSSVV